MDDITTGTETKVRLTAEEVVSGGEVPYIFWRRTGERRPGDMPLVGSRDTFPCMHSGESEKCGQPALWRAVRLNGYVEGPFG
jgi:hypothetical protein